MTTEDRGLNIEIREANPEKLTKEAKETPATGYINSPGKSFSSGDLWNIHRRRKSVMPKRNYM